MSKEDFEQGKLPTESDIEIPKEVEQQISGEHSIDEEPDRNFVGIPKVGESTEELILKDIVVTEDVNKTDTKGKPFSIALKLKASDGVPKGYYAITDKGRMTITSVEVYFKLIALKKLLSLEGFRDCNIPFKLTHILDGMQDKKRENEGKYWKLAIKKDSKWFEVITKKEDKKFINELKEVSS